MRIVHVIDYFHTDVSYQEFHLALEQARAGHHVRVVSTHRRQHTVARPVSSDEEAAGAKALADAGVEVVRLDSTQLGHDRAWVRGLRSEIRGHHPEAVHVHGPFAPTTVRAVLAASDVAAVLVDNHIHEGIAPASSSISGRSTYAAYRAAFGPALRKRVGRWVANGPLEGRFLESRLGLDAEQVTLVPLGFDPDVFTFDRARRDTLRGEMGAGREDLVVAVTGKLHARKHVDEVASAAERRAEHEGVRLVLAGQVDTEVRASVHAAAPRLAAAGCIDIRPMLGRHELADLYLASDVVAFNRLPSISIYEAAGTGARVLAPPDEFGRWLETFDAGIGLFDSAGLLARRDRAEAAAAARRAFAWPSIASRFVGLYQGIPCASSS